MLKTGATYEKRSQGMETWRKAWKPGATHEKRAQTRVKRMTIKM